MREEGETAEWSRNIGRDKASPRGHISRYKTARSDECSKKGMPWRRTRVGWLSVIGLLSLTLFATEAEAAKRQHDKDTQFEFTAKVYNFSFVENGPRVARSDDILRVGVPLLEQCEKVDFRLSGPNKKKFDAESIRIGNFVFLKLLHKAQDSPLNREHEPEYRIMVKALCTRRDRSRVEDSAALNINILDANEQSPLAEKDDHTVNVEGQIAPFTSIYCIEASDADDGLNSEVLFSLVNSSADFYIEPRSGCIHNLRSPLRLNSTTLKVRLEDRASRLFYYDDKTRTPETYTNIQITVEHRKIEKLKLLVEKRPIDTSDEAAEDKQIVAEVTLKDEEENVELILLDNHASGNLFELAKESQPKSSTHLWILSTRPGAKVNSATVVKLRAGTDQNQPERNATLSITIETVERHNISFATGRYEMSVEESAFAGETVGVVTAKPLRREDSTRISYSIEPLANTAENSSTVLPFVIDEETGRIRVRSRLDYVEQREYTFNVMAKLKGYGHQTSTTVVVYVRDSNNHSPEFAVRWTIIDPIAVPEKTKIGSKLLHITALDRDTGENGRIDYKMVSLSRSNDLPFMMNHETGEITLSVPLPVIQSVWEVGVIASDGNRRLPRSSQVNLVFYKNGTKVPKVREPRVLKEPTNEEAPELLQEVEPFSIYEDAVLGAEIGRIHVRDKDPGYAGLVRMATLDSYLAIDPESGLVTVARSLKGLLKPGKSEARHSFEVIAQDMGEPPKQSKRKYTLLVRDVNDHAPQFEKPWYRIRMKENSLKESDTILKMTATDEDGGKNGEVRYELSGGFGGYSEEGNLISIDSSSGEIQLKAPLDREQAEILRFTVAAFDAGEPSRVSFANLTIDVLDENDNAPECSQPITTISVWEDWPDNALLGCVSAHDSDSGVNSELQYTMEKQAKELPFRVDEETGCVFLKLKKPLDYEKRKEYNITIKVADKGVPSLATSCHARLLVKDVDENRHPPVFDEIALEASVYENEPIGTPVINLIVRDADSDSANVTLDIVGGDGRAVFTVVDSDILTTAVLDREAKSAYWLTVRATDMATNSLSSHVFVYVRVNDRSDHSPLFKQPFYEAEVMENSPAGTVVVKVEAEDGDAPSSRRENLFRYVIEKGDPQSFFVIDENTGYIATGGSRKIDREMQKSFHLEVRATTLGDTVMNTATVHVFIRVRDDNDNAPTFVHPNRQFIVPTGRNGSLCRILVKDDDEGVNAALKYSITSIDAIRFRIDDEGVISVRDSMKEGEEVSVDVTVMDGGTPAKSTTTRIGLKAVKQRMLTDGPNLKPIFTNKEEYRYPVSDADVVGNPVGMLSATDANDDKLWWWMVEDKRNETQSDYSSFFYLSVDSGMLMLAKPIDRLPSHVQQVELLARVSDGVDHSDATVVLELSRPSTQRPVFSMSNYSIQTSEKTPIGSSLLTMRATGNASDRPIEYTVAHTETEAAAKAIGIEPSSGTVILIGSLDYEAARLLKLVVCARQGALVSFATLTIEVLDENDNAPVFTRKEYSVLLEKNIRKGALVTTVTAFDADVGENEMIVYSILSGNELNLFTLDPESGDLSLNAPLDPKHFLSILTVKAADRMGKPGSMSDVATLRIKSEKTASGADEPPVFERLLYHRSVRQNTPIGALLLIVQATSDDNHHRYSSLNKCPWFDVHPVSGAVRLRRWLTNLRVRTINCTIVAVSRSGKEATTKIVMKVRHTNEFPPVFESSVYRGVVRENSSAGVTVLQEAEGAPYSSRPLIVSATDKDSGPSALVGYRILREDPYFTVDFISGTIRTKRPLDFEKMREWRFHVVARDMGHPALTSPMAALVIVTITDINDCRPSFTSEYTSIMLLPTVAGVKLLRVRARDEDTIGELRYYAKESKESAGLFHVNPESGEVTVSAESRNFTEKQYALTVLATDGLHSTTTVVRINTKNTSGGVAGLRFAQSVYTATLMENAVPKSAITVATVHAISSSGLPIKYFLLGDRDDFVLSSNTGLLSFVGPTPLDREKEQHVLLVVQAREQSSVSSSWSLHLHDSSNLELAKAVQCIVRVSVSDVNDNAPSILQLPLRVTVPKGTKKGATVLQLHASDADQGNNGTVSFSLVNQPKALTISSIEGKITAAEQLDEDMEMVFQVIASDAGTPQLSTKADIKVEVVDAARPRFKKHFYESRVKTKAAASAAVIVEKVEARSDAADFFIVYLIESGDEENLFKIETDTGEIYVRPDELEAAMERRGANYNLTVIARDATRPQMFDKAYVVVVSEREEKQQIRFKKATYIAEVNEETPVGSELLRVAVEEGEGGDCVYTLEGEGTPKFAVHPSTGAVSIATYVDYEQQKEFIFHVTATRNPGMEQPAKGLVIIQVTDANDEAPIFVQPFATAAISDAAKPGDFVTQLRVIDKDTVSSVPGGGRLQYSVIDGDDTLYAVDKYTGVVSIGREIEEDDLVDRDKVMNISVSDGRQTAFGRLEIHLTSSSSRSLIPRFEQSQYVITTKETTAKISQAALSSTLLSVRALDGLLPLQYTLGGNGDSSGWPVAMDKSTGKIYLKRSITYAEQSVYVIPLVVTDALGRRAFSTFTLRVTDENDSSPEFAVKEYSSSVSAAAKVGESIIQVSAVDEDKDDRVEYALLGETHGLQIEPRTGLVTVGPEARISNIAGRVLQLIIRATDAGNPPHSATANLKVLVAPPDVALPKFANSLYRFSVSEDVDVGHLIGRVQQASTDVVGVRYEISPRSPSLPFSVDKHGKLMVQALLDRENKSVWRFVITARTGDGAIAMTTVVVEVEDVNDNAPLFRGSYEQISITEDAKIGASIVVFSATDEDRATNAKIFFTLLDTDKSSDFNLDGNSGWLTVARRLDREIKAFYELTAQATDEGGKSTLINFTLNIEDVNDSPPVFDETNYTVRIDASSVREGQTIARVIVKDADLPPHNLSRLYIVTGNNDDLFDIDDSGRITLAAHRSSKSLISMGTRTFDLEILATDGLHANRASMKIHSTAPNEETFECPVEKMELEVPENVRVGAGLNETAIKSSKLSLRYTLLSPESNLPFVLDESKGTVKVTAKLDREKRARYVFSRRIEPATYAKSGGVTGVLTPFECYQKITVNVMDVNDSSPVFKKKTYTAAVKENTPATDTKRVYVARVHATDADAGDAGRVSYSILAGETLSAFQMDQNTGVLTLIAPLDREARASYKITVTATDGHKEKPRSTQATVVVTVVDQNDNAPIFERKEYELSVLESEAVGYSLRKVTAVGGDEGERVLYELVEDHPDNKYVQIDRETGEISLAAPLDFEQQSRIAVRVRAVDSGDPPLSAEVPVNIEVLDENDNAPKFMGVSPHKTRISEAAAEGTQIIQMKATDADSGHAGRVFYFLEQSDDVTRSPFGIQEDSGWVTVTRRLDYEKRKNYVLEVTARDGGSPALKTSTRLEIEVEDENDNAPQFEDCNLTAVVQEGTESGHVLISLSVSDADSTKYGGPPFVFAVTGDRAEGFVVDARMDVVTTDRLRKLKQDQFDLMIRATDAGGKYTECPLTVFFRAESRKAPKMSPLSVRLQTLLGEYPGGVIGWMQGTDEDEDDLLRYNIVEHTIVSPSRELPPHSFRVDAETGAVWAAPGIAPGRHNFNVSVSDGKFHTLATVNVEVFDITESVMESSMEVRADRAGGVAEFFAAHMKEFREIMAEVLLIKPEQIRVISIMDVGRDRPAREQRRVRHDKNEKDEDPPRKGAVDIVFVAARHGGRGLIPPKQFYNRMAKDKNAHSLISRAKLNYKVMPDPCVTRTHCTGGCVDEIVFDESTMLKYAVEGETEGETAAFVAPAYERRAKCDCPRGKGGIGCLEEANGCARSRCSRVQMCVPLENRPGGRVECYCPPGLAGEKCDENDMCEGEAGNATECRGATPIHVDGAGFFEMDLPVSVEERMELQLDIRTTSRDGILMWTEGEGADNHAIEISGGTLAYRWNGGMGEQEVASSTEVADGRWHTVWVKRVNRVVTMVVDKGARISSEAPAGAEVVNLWKWRKTFVFGAKVNFHKNDRSQYELSQGMAACFRRFKLDGKPLLLTSSGLRLNGGARPGCRPLPASDCFSPDGGERVCKHHARCVVHQGGYKCDCPSERYRGARCEIDTDPCGVTYPPKSCPIGECIPFLSGHGDYTCKCPQGFTGKHCDARNPNWSLERTICEEQPNICGKEGKCIFFLPDQKIGHGNYICNCSGTYKNSCDEVGFSFIADYGKELIVGLISLMVLCVLAALIYLYCKWRNDRSDKGGYGEHVYAPHGINPNLLAAPSLSTTNSTLLQQQNLTAVPPPLPPRAGRQARPKLEVRPFAAEERLSSSRGDSGSPSLAGSFHKKRGSNGLLGRMSNNQREESERCEASCADSSTRRELEALRRFGMKIPDTPETRGNPPPPLHARRVRGRGSKSRDEDCQNALLNGRRSHGNDWEEMEETNDRIALAIEHEQERRKKRDGMPLVEGKVQGSRAAFFAANPSGRVCAGDTLLSPIEHDPEYMTMRPRSTTEIAEHSQTRPLLTAEQNHHSSFDGPMSTSICPPAPPHQKMTPSTQKEDYDSSAWQSHLYDDPLDTSMYRSDPTTIDDIDATDEEADFTSTQLASTAAS